MFYERVRAEPTLPFADALRDIRKLAYEGDDPEDSWAAYCFYGDQPLIGYGRPRTSRNKAYPTKATMSRSACATISGAIRPVRWNQ